MRLWSIHPQYLDSKGLVALWRETLLAKNVLEGNTKGYLNHPQLDRFKASTNTLDYINYYLETIYTESQLRNYNFNANKFYKCEVELKLTVTTGQIKYEFEHLQKKLMIRDYNRYKLNSKEREIKINSVFKLTQGDIEKWEKVN